MSARIENRKLIVRAGKHDVAVLVDLKASGARKELAGIAKKHEEAVAIDREVEIVRSLAQLAVTEVEPWRVERHAFAGAACAEQARERQINRLEAVRVDVGDVVADLTE